MGKTALVTGGSRGIGKAICERLAKDGMDVVFSYQSSDEQAMAVEKACRDYGVRTKAVKADVSDSLTCEMLVKEAAAFGDGSIEVLVNNAGITKDGLIMKMKDEDLDAVLNVNLKGSFYMMRAVSKLMLRKKKGCIINISSVVGLRGNAGQVNYAASKAAVIGMTKSLAKELASRKISVNAVAPGMIATEMTDAIPENARETILNSVPFKKLGTPEDVAGVVSFLAGEDAKYITGQVICVDGGMTI